MNFLFMPGEMTVKVQSKVLNISWQSQFFPIYFNLKFKINFASVNLENVVNLKTNKNLLELGNLKYNSNVK